MAGLGVFSHSRSDPLAPLSGACGYLSNLFHGRPSVVIGPYGGLAFCGLFGWAIRVGLRGAATETALGAPAFGLSVSIG